MGCACGSHRQGRTRSIDLTKNFEEKLAELDVVCEDLNDLYQRYAVLKA